MSTLDVGSIDIWNPEIETMPRVQRAELMAVNLRKTVQLVYDRVPFYRRTFDEAGVTPDEIRTMDDIARLPFTNKSDLRDNYPYGLLAVPLEEVARVHASSGTTGKPTVITYNQNDLDIWSEVMARTLRMGGVDHRDVIHNAYGYGLFTGGLGIHMGGERVGAAVVPVSGGFTKRQIMILEDFRPTVLTSTPSFALVLAETAEEMGVDLRQRTRLRVGFFGAEPSTSRMRDEIEARMGITALDIYGLTEMGGPGTGQECMHKCGLHLQEDHFYPEIIDPDTLEPLGYGKRGELVFTSLTRQSMPLVRYRTRDITTLWDEPCACGRTTVRMDKITGRTDDMLIVRGVNVFPSQIERVLLGIQGLVPQYVIVVDRDKRYLDEITVQVEASDDLFAQGQEAVAAVRSMTSTDLHQALGISVDVVVAEPKSLQRSEGKARRVIDKREL